MKNWLTRVVESGFSPTDDADTRLKKVALTLVPLIIGPAAFVWGTLYFLLGHSLSGSIPLSYAIISAISLAYFFRTKATWFIQYSQLLLVLVLPFLLMWSLGGFAAGSMVMIWAIFAPVAALLFMRKEAALKWFLAYLALILCSALLDRHLAASVSPLPDLARSLFYVLNMGCGSAGLYLLVSYFIQEEKRAIGQLQEEQARLEEGTQKLNQEIAERKAAEQALIAARDEADRANHAKSDFLSSMSHELRTPMNAILGFSQLMATDDSLATEHQEGVAEILKAGHHLLNLINEVLDLAKIESGHVDLTLEPVAVRPLVEECLSLVGTLAARREVRMGHAVPEEAVVQADRTRLKQALLNLLSNAIKYNHHGGSVSLDVHQVDGSRLRIRVTDTGPGIASERLPELCQPFNRLGAENSNIEGAGIGLSITRRLVEMMGGTLEVESKTGIGSTFWIELPLESPPQPAPEAAIPVGAATVQPPNPARHTVLYIEDNPANLKLVAQILGRRPHILLITAHTAELGIELARERHPDLILLDINLPGVDGYRLLEVIRKEAGLEGTPVIALTANALSSDIEQGMAAGFSDYLTKPLNVDRFFGLLDRFLTSRSSAL